MSRVYVQVWDGEWTRPSRRKFKDMCCDCGLVHYTDYRIKDGHIEFRVHRNGRATANARRQFKFKKERGDE